MPANRPNPRPAGGLLIALLLAAILIPAAVSAELIHDEEISFYNFTGGSNIYKAGVSGTTAKPFNYLHTEQIRNVEQLYYVGIDCDYDLPALEEGSQPLTYTLEGQTSKSGTMRVTKFRNVFGSVIKTQVLLFFDDWDIELLSGAKSVTFTPSLGTFSSATGGQGYFVGDGPFTATKLGSSKGYTITTSSGVDLENHIQISDDGITTTINLRRVYDDKSSLSELIVYNPEGNQIYYDHSDRDLLFWVSSDAVENITLNLQDVSKVYTLDESLGMPDESTVTVYVQSSQTGALLANSHLSILAAAGGTEVEIINATLPGGTATYTLQPTGGGLTNPDYYRAVATVPGFTQIVENHSFTLNGPHDVIIEMRPDTGGPTDPERCYLEFYVRDLNANPIPAASIQCGGRILQTNSAGYAVFEVAKNASHPWIAKKSGYVTIEGTATVADGPRYVVNVVLGPGTVPTYTPGPGETPGGPGATPTPDRRTNEQKGQSIIDMIADNAEPLVALALLGTFLGLFKLMAKW